MTDQVVIQFSTASSSLANWVSALIRRMCHSPFSHVDLVLPDGSLLGASDQGPNSPCIRGNPKGVAIRPSDYQEFGYRRRMIIHTDKADAIIAAAMTQLGKPFDSTGLHDFVSDTFPGTKDWRNPDAWFCAELVTFSFEAGGYWLPLTQLPWPKNRVSPTDVLMLFLMDPNWINRDTFWESVPGLRLGKYEKP